MDIHTTITISRQLGSEGNKIAKGLSLNLGIPYYDKEAIKKAAIAHGLYHDLPEDYEEKPTDSLLYSLVMDPHSFINNFGFSDIPISQKIFKATINAIKSLAAIGPCIIIGRCADHALSERNNCCNLFIYAPLEKRIENLCKRKSLTPVKAEEIIVKSDKQRARYYSYFTDKKWGDYKNYHMSIDSSILGVEKTIALIENYIQIHETINNR